MLKNLKVKHMKTFWGKSIPIISLVFVLLIWILFACEVSPYMDASNNHPIDCECSYCEYLPHPVDCDCDTCVADEYVYTVKEFACAFVIASAFVLCFCLTDALLSLSFDYTKMYEFLQDIERYNAHYPQLVQLTPERYKDLKLLYKETRDHVHELYILSVANKKNN